MRYKPSPRQIAKLFFCPHFHHLAGVMLAVAVSPAKLTRHVLVSILKKDVRKEEKEKGKADGESKNRMTMKETGINGATLKCVCVYRPAQGEQAHLEDEDRSLIHFNSDIFA